MNLKNKKNIIKNGNYRNVSIDKTSWRSDLTFLSQDEELQNVFYNKKIFVVAFVHEPMLDISEKHKTRSDSHSLPHLLVRKINLP